MKLFIKILLVILWTGLGAGAIVLMGFANKNHDSRPCTGLDIRMDYAGSEPMMTNTDIKKQLLAAFGPVEKKTLSELNLEKFHQFLHKNPYIDKADVHTSIEGKLVIDIRQCVPLVRIILPNNLSYFLDENGKLIPVNPDYPVRVLIASGNIAVPLLPGRSIFNKTKLKGEAARSLNILMNIHDLAFQMRSDSVMNAMVEQVYVKTDGNFRLVTKAGSHLVEFGDNSDASEKIENLKAFYKYGLTKTGWDKYKVVNVTYKNQVVCTK